jgi:hypothetical protein
MNKALILLTLSFVSLGSLHAQQCSDLDKVEFNAPTTSDVKEHVVPSDGGDHHFVSTFDKVCRYQSNAVAPTQYCVTTSSTQVAITSAVESGELTNLLFSHFIGANAKGGLQTGVNGATATTGGTAAGAVRDCVTSCDVTIQLDASADGVGIKVTFPPSTVWTQPVADGISCGPVLDPTFAPPCDPSDPSCCPSQSQVAPGQVGALTQPPLECPPEGCPCTPPIVSPIIIDTEGEGFHLTSAENGVTFDIRGDGQPMRISWTAPGYHNAFLALDRDGSGAITSGKELFGNVTAQPQSATPNGFLALAEFDKPENGGNGDGVIDEHDAVFSKLVLWIDDNHDGISQPSELHKLSEFGIHSLSVSYFESRKTDEFGNQFRYKARVNPREQDRDSRDETVAGEVGRWAYDVFFVSK